jgi:hypothetical protein
MSYITPLSSNLSTFCLNLLDSHHEKTNMIAPPSVLAGGVSPLDQSRLFLLGLAPRVGSREIWIKFGHNSLYRAQWDEHGNLSGIATKLTQKDVSTSRVDVGPWIADLTSHIAQRAMTEEGGVFYIPTQPQGLPTAASVTETDDIGIEMDHLSRELQLEIFADFTAVTGLEFSSTLSSGGKSIHAHIKCDRHVPIEEMEYLRRLAIVAFNSDPATARLHQPMRLPGFYRAEKGAYQELLSICHRRYSVDELVAGVRVWFEAKGWAFPEALGDRWYKNIFQRMYRSSNSQTHEQKLESTRQELERGEVAWTASQVRTQAAPIRSIQDGSLIEAVTRANCEATANSFNLFGGSRRGQCPFHEGSSGSSAWVSDAHDGARFHCSTCTNDDPRSLFDFYVAQTGQSSIQNGHGLKSRAFVDAAKLFLPMHGYSVPEMAPRTRYVEGAAVSLVAPIERDKAAEKAARLERAKASLSCTRTPDVVLNDRYLDITKLPELLPGQVVAISSPLGTGKTEFASALKRKYGEKDPDAPVTLLGHRNSLLLQSCQRLGIPHIWQLERDYPGRIDYGLGVEKAVGMCIDSMTKPDWDKLGPKPLFVADESESVMGHVTGGETFGDRHNEVLGLFQSVLTRALATGGNLVTMEEGLTDASLDFYEELTGVRPLYVRNDWLPQKQAEFQTTGETGFIEQTLRELESGLLVSFPSDSQKIGEKLDLLANERIPGIPMLRCDAKTSEVPEVKRFLADPDGEIERNGYRLIIYSPSVESGLNITAPGYHVRAYFNNGGTRSQYQQLGRVRNPESIKIYCAPRGLRNGPTYPSQILKDAAVLKKHTAMLTGLRAELEGDDAAIAKLNETLSDSDKKELFWAKHTAILEARANLLSRDMADNLRNYLRDRGWTITEVEGVKDDGIKEALKVAKEVIERGEAALKFRLTGGQDAETAKRILGSGSAKYEDRVNAQKSMLMLALPGATLSEEYLLEMVVTDRGRGLKSTTLAWMYEHPEIAKRIDQANFRSQLSKNFVLSRRLTHFSQKVDLLQQSGVMDIKAASDAGEKIHENHPLIVAFRKSMLDNAASVRRVTGLNMNDEQTGMEMFSKLGRQVGLALECTGQVGGRNERRVRTYKVVCTIDEAHMKETFDALDRKWGADLESVHVISSNTNSYIEMTCTEPEPMPIEEIPPPIAQGQQVTFSLDQSVCVVQRVEGGGAILKRIDNPFQTQTFFAKFHELRAS